MLFGIWVSIATWKMGVRLMRYCSRACLALTLPYLIFPWVVAVAWLPIRITFDLTSCDSLLPIIPFLGLLTITLCLFSAGASPKMIAPDIAVNVMLKSKSLKSAWEAQDVQNAKLQSNKCEQSFSCLRAWANSLGRRLCHLAQCPTVSVLAFPPSADAPPVPIHVLKGLDTLSVENAWPPPGVLTELAERLAYRTASTAEVPGGLLWAAVGCEDVLERLAALELGPCFCIVISGAEAELRCRPELLGIAELLRGVEDLEKGEEHVLPPAIRQLLLEDFNATEHAYEPDLVHRRFLIRAKSVPAGHSALVSHGPAGDVSATSYQDLAEKAVQAARWLMERKISGPVAVWMPRSETVVVSALAILMVGGVYVPCDDRLPWQRVQHMVEDAGVILILAGPQQLQLIPSSIPAVDGSLLSEPTEQHTRDDCMLPASIDCDELAYVIFTSGSTGKPKGVAVTHRSIVHLIDWVNSTFNVTQRDALLFTTSIGFDLSCYDIFGSLSAGSTIHFWPGSAASPDQLFEVLVSFKISFWDSAPQVLQQLEPRLAEAAPPLANDLRLVFLSGDWVPISLVQSLLRAGPGGALQVVALGGATEVTVWSNYFEVPLIDADWPSIPYGRPIWNHQYYCLGQSGPVHVGTTGELYIGGVGVTQGYIGRPDLTAERFLPNSFHSGRMYRTGDMVRFMPLKPWGDPSGLQQFNASDVVLEFLGRVDSQVKVRGYRVELAEVELAFLKQPGIETASVLALPSGENAAGWKTLVAFVVAEEGVAEAARQRAGQVLPAYMVPDVCVCLHELPLSHSGKPDKSKLRSLWEARSRRSNDVQEGSGWEREVAEVFQEVLGQAVPVGIHEDFFDLGGHSLSTMKLQAALKLKSEAEVTLADVLRARTPKRLAQMLLDAEAKLKQRQVSAPPLLPVSSNQPLASFAQERLWLVDQLFPGSAAYNVPFAFRLSAQHTSLTLAGLLAGLEALVRNHSVLRTALVQDTTSLVQKINDMVSIHLPNPLSAAACLSSWLWFHPPSSDIWSEAAEGAAELMRLDASRGFQLDHCLLRVHVFCMPENDKSNFLVYFNVHHAAFDAMSQALLEKELLERLTSDSPCPAPSLQYSDYAVWQRAFLAAGEEQRCLDIWASELAGVGLSLCLPFDAPLPRNGEAAAGELVSEWPAESLGALRKAAAQLGASEMALLLSLFGLALGCRCGQEELLVGIPEAGRSKTPELQKILGFFVNTLPIRLQLFGEALPTNDRRIDRRYRRIYTLGQLVQRTQGRLLAALDAAALPFQRLVAELRKTRGEEMDVQSERNPIVQAFFQHVIPGQFADGSRELARQKGLEVEDFDFGPIPTAAKFEVSLQTSASAHGRLNLRWEFMREVLARTSIEILDRHLYAMTRRIAAASESESPKMLTAELGLAPHDEREALHSWASSQALPLPDHLRVEGLFLQQAKRTPKQTALSSDGVSLSYEALARAARGLASSLSTALKEAPGHDPTQTVVGVFANRCLELPIAVLAVLLVGASFLPLAPENPLERLCFMVSQAMAAALLSTRSLAEAGLRIVNQSDRRILFLEVRVHEDVDQMEQVPISSSAKSTAAYVLFTSGSTGKPKGVLLSHRALLSHLLPYIRTLGLKGSDQVLLTSSFSFDMAYSQIFGALLSGATLMLTKENPMTDPSELWEIMKKKTVTFTTVVPSVLSAMVHLTTEPLALPSLRHLGCGGEALASAAKEYYSRAPTSRVLLHNRYGPTECAINALLFGPSPLQEVAGEDVPIGWASSHRHVHLKTEGQACEQDLLMLGLGGELLLAGLGLARGYVAAPELSDQAFRESSRGAGKSYHTGDLVIRERSRDGLRGCLRFCGRKDLQVKLRGQRVELAEIERVLCRHSAVEAAVSVLAPAGSAGSGSGTPGVASDESGILVAVVSAKETSSTLLPELLEICRTSLPGSMVPQRILFWKTAAWSRTTSGKVDRRTLAASVAAELRKARETREEKGPASRASRQEDDLLAILREVTGRAPTSPSQPLESLGLTSLSAVRVASMALDRQIQISVRQMLSPGASIARLIEESSRLRVGSSHAAIQDVVALLMGSESIRWKPLAQSDAHKEVCEVLVCPGDGGAGIDGYRPLAQSLLEAATAAVSAADGLLSEDAQHAESLDDLAEVLRQRCASEHQDLILLGHSWGATLALVLARGLVAAGRAVKAVWLLDPSAEHLTPDLPTPPVAEEALRDFLAMMLRLVSQGTAAWGAARQVLQDAYHAACMGKTTEVEEGLGASWLCVERAATHRSRNLGLQPLSLGPLPMPIHVMLARREDESSAEGTRRRQEVEARLGHMSADVSVAWACGNHHSMIEPANCASLVTGLVQSTDFLCGT
eukprot:s451_g6.t1